MAADLDLGDLLRRLSAQATALPLCGRDVEVLKSPDDFYAELLVGLRTAQHHISIASLYFGTGGGREQEFADALAAAAHDTSRPQLHIHILLDALRSTRPTHGDSGSDGSMNGSIGNGVGSPGGNGGAAAMTSTAEMLATRLLESQTRAAASAASKDAQRAEATQRARVAVSLFHTPALRGLLKRVLPPRVSEVIGVCHCKAYCFDDTVIISGANISSTYLSTRQDRYLVLRNAPQLASLLRQVVDTVGQFSYQLQPLTHVAHPTTGAVGGVESAGAAAGADASASATGSIGGTRRRRDVLLDLLQRQQLPWQQLLWSQLDGSGPTMPHRPHHLQCHRQQRLQRYRLAPCPVGVDPVRQAYLFTAAFRQALLQLFAPRQDWTGLLDVAVLAAQEEAAAEEASAAGAAASSSTQDQGQGTSTHSVEEAWRRGAASPSAEPFTAAAASKAAASPVEAAGGADTWIVPMVQAGFAGVRQEERCTLAMLAWATQQQSQPEPAMPEGGPSSRRSNLSGGNNLSVLLQLASPYLNLARPYEWFLSRQAADASLEIITASPEANGFFGSKGVSGYIPLAYSLLEQRTWRRLNRHQHLRSRGSIAGDDSGGHVGGGIPGSMAGWRMRHLAWRERWARHAARDKASRGVPVGDTASGLAGSPALSAQATVLPYRRLWEYCREGWEFHAKGIWVSPPAGLQQQQTTQMQQLGQQQQPAGVPQEAAPWNKGPGWAPPFVTAVGSSNFGFRSLHRDLEVQFLLITRNPKLREALGREVAALKHHCQQVAGDTHFSAPGRRGGAVTRLAVRLLRGFL